MDSISKLNLACGQEYLTGYFNVDDGSFWPDAKIDQKSDILTMEWSENSLDEIRLSHFAMYLRPENLAPLFKRWYGWLKVGGKFEVECIDVKKMAKIVASSQPQSIIDSWGLTNLFGNLATSPHRWGWTAKSMTPFLYQAGFSEVRVKRGVKKPDRDFLIIAIK